MNYLLPSKYEFLLNMYSHKPPTPQKQDVTQSHFEGLNKEFSLS